MLDNAQCSECEFIEGLRRARAFEINGCYRMLDEAYELRCITLMLNVIEENSWKPYEVDRDETINALKYIVPKDVLVGLFDLYTKQSNIPGKYQYIDDMVSKIILTNILLPGLKFNYDELILTWEDALPNGMVVNVSIIF